MLKESVRTRAVRLSCTACFALLVQTGVAPTAAKVDTPSRPSAPAAGTVWLGFVQNDIGGANSAVKYNARGPRFDVHFTSDSALFRSSADALTLRYVGADRGVVLRAQHQLAGRINYLIGTDRSEWRTAVPAYGELVYAGLWSGIDLVYKIDGDRLKYEFVVHPGAQPERILLGYQGADTVSIDANGNLIIRTESGATLQDERPRTYQRRGGRQIEIASRFALRARPGSDHRVGFDVGDYDTRLPLVIDPGLIYSTYVGGEGDDIGRSIAVDRGGNVYVVGSTVSPQFPATSDALDPTCGTDGACNPSFGFGRGDAFIAKFDASGALVYATYLGGSSTDASPLGSGPAIAVDDEGSVYIGGVTFSTDFPTTENAFRRLRSGTQDGFLTKLDGAGAALLYSTYFGGTSSDNITGVAVDGLGQVYVTGETSSTNLPTRQAYQGARNGFSADAFVAKFNPTAMLADASLVYSTYFGGTRRDFGSGIVVNAAGEAIVSGRTESANLPLLNAFDTLYNGFGGDVFVAKFAASGSALLYATYLGGSLPEEGNGIAMDNGGAVYVVGSTESAASSGFPTTAGAYDRTYNGYTDAFVAKIDTGLIGQSSLVYSTYVGGGYADVGWDIAVDQAGAAYITGRTLSHSVFDPTANASSDVFVANLDPTGARLRHGAFFGGSGFDTAFGIAVEPSGIAYVTGQTDSVDFPATTRAFDEGCGVDGNCDPHPVFKFKSYDAFVLKVALGGAQAAALPSPRVTPPAPEARLAAAPPRPRRSTLFVANAGQLPPSVRYTAFGGGYTAHFTPGGVAFAFPDRTLHERSEVTNAAWTPGDASAGTRVRMVPVALQFIDANPQPVIKGAHPNGARINYLTGRDAGAWRTNVAAYDEVTYRELWPGIDLTFRGSEARLKYDFVVQPGANVNAIRFAYRGTEGVSIDDEGDLRIKTSTGVLVDERPQSYQRFGDRVVPIDTRFVMRRATNGEQLVGFEVDASYDRRAPLVIDPGLQYSTFFGGSLEELSAGVVTTGSGELFVYGSTSSADFPVTAGSFDPTFNDVSPFWWFLSDVFIAKFTNRGELVYATFLGGTGTDKGGVEGGPAIAVDKTGNAYITGYTFSTDFPTTAAALKRTISGTGADIFVAKLNPEGTALLYSTYLGGNDRGPAFGPREFGNTIAADDSGHVWVTGRTSSTDFPVSPGALGPTYRSPVSGSFSDFERGGDGFLTRLDTNASGAASLVYSTYLGGNNADYGIALAVDGIGRGHVLMQTRSTDLPTPRAFDATMSGGFYGDVYVAAIDPNGTSVLYGSYLGGTLSDWANGIAVDRTGKTYIVGSTESPAFPTTAGSYDRTYNGNTDAFVAKLDTAATGLASLVYSTFFGGGHADVGRSLTVDLAGAVYLTGRTLSIGLFDPSGTDSSDGFVAKLNPKGAALQFGVLFGGSRFDLPISVAVDQAGLAYVTGITDSSDFPVTANAFDATCGSDGNCAGFPGVTFRQYDIFVLKVAPGGVGR